MHYCYYLCSLFTIYPIIFQFVTASSAYSCSSTAPCCINSRRLSILSAAEAVCLGIQDRKERERARRGRMGWGHFQGKLGAGPSQRYTLCTINILYSVHCINLVYSGQYSTFTYFTVHTVTIHNTLQAYVYCNCYCYLILQLHLHSSRTTKSLPHCVAVLYYSSSYTYSWSTQYIYTVHIPISSPGEGGKRPLEGGRPLSALTHIVIPGDHKIHVTSNDLIVCPSSKLIFIEEKCKSLKVLNNFLFFTYKEKTLNFFIFQT